MPQYVVQGPDGRSYVVEGPGGASAPRGGATPTPAAQAASEAAARPLGATLASYGRSAKAGVGDAAISTVLGVKQLFGGLSEDDKLAMRGMKMSEEEDENKFTRGVGNVVGNIAMTAIPGAAAERGVKAAIGTRALLQRALAAGLGGGATEFVTSVGEGDSYADQMKSKLGNAGVAALTGGLLHGGMEKLAKPFQATAEAEKLFRQGVNPTLQQGAEGRVGRFIGGLAAGAVDVAPRQQQEVAEALLKRVTDGNVSMPRALGKEYADAAGHYVQDEYSKVFQGKRFPLAPKVLGKAVAAAGEVNPQGQMAREAGMAARKVGNIIGPDDMNKVNRNVNYQTFRDGYLNRLARAAAEEPDQEIRKRILDSRDVLIQKLRNPRLSADELARVEGVLDPKWYDVKRMQEATKSVAGEAEGMTIGKLARSYGSASKMAANSTAEDLVNPALRVIGDIPRQDEARAAKMALNRVLAGSVGAGATLGGYGIPAAALYGTSLLGQTAGGAKVLLGQTAKQRRMAELLRRGALVGALVPGATTQDYPTEEDYAP